MTGLGQPHPMFLAPGGLRKVRLSHAGSRVRAGAPKVKRAFLEDQKVLGGTCFSPLLLRPGSTLLRKMHGSPESKIQQELFFGPSDPGVLQPAHPLSTRPCISPIRDALGY